MGTELKLKVAAERCGHLLSEGGDIGVAAPWPTLLSACRLLTSWGGEEGACGPRLAS